MDHEMSDYSSPASSHRSSCSSFSSGPRSPDTTFTTPPASRESSPKLFGSVIVPTDQATQQKTETYPYFHSPSPAFTQLSPMPSPEASYTTPHQIYTAFDESMCLVPETTSFAQSQSQYDTELPTINAPQPPAYPPASSFYSSSPTQSSVGYSTCWSPDTPLSSPWDYEACSEQVDPFDYKIEEWYTADGRRVEYSAMALGCATM